MTSFFAVTFIMNTVFMVQPTDVGPAVTEMCSLVIDGEDKGLLVGSCKEAGEEMVKTWSDKYPDSPWHLVVDGYDYNLM